MVTCQECHSTYRELERECPSCGTARPESRRVDRRCGSVSYACLWITRVIMIIAGPVSLFFGCKAFIHGNYLAAAGCVVAVLIYWGLSAAIGLAIDYADSP